MRAALDLIYIKLQNQANHELGIQGFMTLK